MGCSARTVLLIVNSNISLSPPIARLLLNMSVVTIVTVDVVPATAVTPVAEMKLVAPLVLVGAAKKSSLLIS